MKLYLFGGAEIDLNQVRPLKDLIKKTIVELHPTSVLHIPYARLHSTEEEWYEGWFKDEMKDTGVEILDARNQEDVNRAIHPFIFINGGIDRRNLVCELQNQQNLLDIVLHAQHIVAESSGSMAMGEFLRGDRNGTEIIRGLGILKDTIIEPHYSERNSQQLLRDDMQKSGMKYGIGIDCATAIVVDPSQFPTKWTKIGAGNVDVQVRNQL